MTMDSEGCEVLTTPCEKIWLGKDGILRTQMLQNAKITLALAEEGHRAYVKASGGKKCPLLVDTRGIIFSLDREARALYSGPKGALYYTAVVILVDSPVNRIVGNFFLGLNKTAFPFKLFESETAALEWLKQYRL